VIEKDAQITGFSAIGAGSCVGAGAVIEDSILWPGARVAPGAHLQRCIVRAGRAVEGRQSDAVI
jgi:mannose-1-phosphate guanylyltransferase